MTIDKAEVLRRCQGITAETVFPFPTERPFQRQIMLHLLNFTTEIAHCWIKDPNQPEDYPLFPGALEDVKAFATQLVARDNQLRTVIANLRGNAALPWDSRLRDHNRFAGTFLGGRDKVHNTRPFIKLMFDAEAEEDAYYYIADVVERMLEAAGSLKSVHMALVIGERDFKKAGVSAWVRARTLLLAKHYEIWIAMSSQRLIHVDPHAYFNPVVAESVAHVPNITTRQARRSGLTEQELRARWE